MIERRIRPLVLEALRDTRVVMVMGGAASPPRIVGAPIGRRAFASRVAAGGYPEALGRTGRRRDRWFANYLTTTFELE